MSIAELEQHRVALTGHCYRMMGSAVDADDAVQETMVRAWRSMDRFDGRAQLRTWLYRIATNVCLDMLAERKRRARPVEEGPPGTIDDPLEALPRAHWLEPIAEARAIPADVDPSEQIALRQSIRLAFVAALQHLPPQQRAALLLAEVLGWSAAEIAECLGTSVAAVNSALQRARGTLGTRDVRAADAGTLSEVQAKLVESYVDAFLRYDVDALVSLLHRDATLSMPPFPLWLRGAETIRAWLLGRGAACARSRIERVAASGLPALAQWKRSEKGEGYDAFAIVVLELAGDRIAAWTSFLDVESHFPRFGLPLRVPA